MTVVIRRAGQNPGDRPGHGNGRKDLAMGALAVTMLAASAVSHDRPLLVWNASASSPRGLYVVAPSGGFGTGDKVVAHPPPAAARLAAERGYLPQEVPLVKTVVAVAGNCVCAQGKQLTVDTRIVALRLPLDTAGR